MCELHKGAIIADYLNNQNELPIDFTIFQEMCPDISEVVVSQ